MSFVKEKGDTASVQWFTGFTEAVDLQVDE